MNKLYKMAYTLARASDGNPVSSTATVILFALMFNVFEAAIETLIWGDRLQHWLDPVFLACFIAYAAFQVYVCAIYNSHKNVRQSAGEGEL